MNMQSIYDMGYKDGFNDGAYPARLSQSVQDLKVKLVAAITDKNHLAEKLHRAKAELGQARKEHDGTCRAYEKQWAARDAEFKQVLATRAEDLHDISRMQGELEMLRADRDAEYNDGYATACKFKQADIVERDVQLNRALVDNAELRTANERLAEDMRWRRAALLEAQAGYRAAHKALRAVKEALKNV